MVKSATELLNWGELEVNEGKKQLYKRHLIQRVEERDACYEIHPLIREFLQIKLSKLDESDKFMQRFANVFVKLSHRIPKSLNLTDIESLKMVIPHLEQVTKNLIYLVSDEDLIYPFVGLGNFYYGQGSYPIAEYWCQQCLLVAKSRLGEEHSHVATSLSYLAFIYFAQARFWKSTLLCRQALIISKIALGLNHPKTNLRRISLVATILAQIFLWLYCVKFICDFLLYPSLISFLKLVVQIFLSWFFLKKGFLLEGQLKKIRWFVYKLRLNHRNTVIFHKKYSKFKL